MHCNLGCADQFPDGKISWTLPKGTSEVVLMDNCDWDQAKLTEDQVYKSTIPRPRENTSDPIT